MIMNKKDYYTLLYTLRERIKEDSSDLYSVIAYGSACRMEMIPNYSDVDILAIIKDECLSERTSQTLNRIMLELANVNIKIHLRVRNLYDLENKTSGLFDCGVTSAINKLRDSIVLCGESMDNYYLSYLNTVKEEEILSNISFRFSDLKYQSRALLSLCSGGLGANISADLINYKAGCILYQLAELICYSRGILFENSNSCISKVHQFYDSHLFSLAYRLKLGESAIDIPRLVSEVDHIINSAVKTIDKSKLKNLLKVKIQDSVAHEEDCYVRSWRELISESGFAPGSLVVKKAAIDDGVLTINRYRI